MDPSGNTPTSKRTNSQTRHMSTQSPDPNLWLQKQNRALDYLDHSFQVFTFLPTYQTLRRKHPNLYF